MLCLAISLRGNYYSEPHVFRLVIDGQASGLWIDGEQILAGNISTSAALTRWELPASDVEWAQVLAFGKRLSSVDRANLYAHLYSEDLGQSTE